MTAEYIREKITDLRIKKGVSEHRMSLDLGHARSYIHGIVSGRTLPSMQEFLIICDYFGITPEQFFHDSSNSNNPILINSLLKEAYKLKDEDISLVVTLMKRISAGYSNTSK